MNNLRFIRWSSLAIIIAAISMLAAEFTRDTPLIIYGVILFGTLIGFIGIHQYQKESAGILSLISIIALLLTFISFSSGYDDLGDIAFPIAILLLGIASLRAGKFPPWASGALILGGIISVIGSFLPSIPRTADIIDSLILTMGFFTIGYTLWNDAEPAQAA